MSDVSARPLVEVKGLKKTFRIPGGWPWSPSREVEALKGVDFSLAAGEIVALVGQSGSGKTTLSRIILGLEPATAGSVRVLDQAWDQMPESERRPMRAKIQYVPQDAMAALDPQQTVIEHVIETLTVLAGNNRDEAQVGAVKMLARLGLGHRHHALPRELSGGEQRRVTLARVLALDPRIIVADEPTSGLDPQRRETVLKDLIGNLPDGAGCILVTHDLDAAESYCDRAVVMLRGEIIEDFNLRNERPRHPYTMSLLDPWQDTPHGAP